MTNENQESSTQAIASHATPRWATLVMILMVVPLAALIVSVWMYGGQFGWHLSLKHENWGQFGDFLGGFVGTVLAAATLVAIALTLWLQSRALDDTREALLKQQRSAEEQLNAARRLYTAAQEANELTRAAMKQSLELERARYRPHVIFTIDFETEQRRYDTITHAYARVRNIGATAAHNVKVTTSPALRGRLGVDTEPRQPATVDTTLAFMPPNHEEKDLLAYAPFLFEDNKDEELRFSVRLEYADGRGETFEETYAIDLATLRHAFVHIDTGQMNLIKIAEHIAVAAKALDALVRIHDSPDRSLFMQPMATEKSLSLSPAQLGLLRNLISLSKQTDSMSFFVTRPLGDDDRALIRPMGREIEGAQEPMELRAPAEDVDYLCRAGALQGAYRHGSLYFALAPAAEGFVNEKGLNTGALDAKPA